MNIVTLYEHSDLAMRKSLDRYLSQLSKNGGVHVWNDEQVLPGEDVDAVMHEQLKNADLMLLLISQDFWASETCYRQAAAALEMRKENPPGRRSLPNHGFLLLLHHGKVFQHHGVLQPDGSLHGGAVSGPAPEVYNLIEKKQYFLIHAPRQTGKTTLLHALAHRLNGEGKYIGCMLSVETAEIAWEGPLKWEDTTRNGKRVTVVEM